MVTARWQPTDKQHTFLTCPIEDVFFGGTRGPGKTEALCADFWQHSILHGENAKGILLRRSYPELEEVEARCVSLFAPYGAKYNMSRKTWHFSNGAQLRLRHIKTTKDAALYQGHGSTWVGADELTTWPSLAPLDMLRATMRSSKGVPVYFRGTGNPGGPGHNEVKIRYIDPAPPMTPFDDTVQIGDTSVTVKRVFIPATLDDNPHLMMNDPNYWQRVVLAAAGREDLLKAWRYGIWDIVAGGMFDDLWDPGMHILEPFRIPQSWHINRTFDWGETKPFCVLWFAESNGERLSDGRSWPRGSLFVIAEDYGWNGKPNQGLKLNAIKIAGRIKEAERKMAYKVAPGGADLPAVQNGQSIEADMRKVGVHWRKPIKGPGSRVTKWSGVRQMLTASLQEPMEEPGLFVFSNCRQFIRTVPVIPRDEKNPDDVDTDAEDHVLDALGLRVAARRGQTRRLTVVT